MYFVVKKDAKSDTYYSENYGAIQIIVHPNYNATTGVNDVAIVIADRYFCFSRAVQVVCMPGLNEP